MDRLHLASAGPGTLRIFTSRQGCCVLASLTGDLDVIAVPCLEDWVRRLARPALAVRLDISGLSFADIAGTRALAQACALMRDRCLDFELIGIPPAVSRTMRLTGISLAGADGRPTAAGRGGGGAGRPAGSISGLPTSSLRSRSYPGAESAARSPAG